LETELTKWLTKELKQGRIGEFVLQEFARKCIALKNNTYTCTMVNALDKTVKSNHDMLFT
jgi:hypothetical protein